MLVPSDEVRYGDLVVAADRRADSGWFDPHPELSDHVLVFREEAPEPLVRQTRGRMVPPTLEEINAEIVRLGYEIDAVRFKAHYDANGWVQKGGTPIRNWKAALTTWVRYDIQSGARTGKLAAVPPGEVAVRTWHDKDAPGWIAEAGKKLAAPPSVDRKDYEPNGRLYVSPKRQLAFGRWISGENIKDPG